MPNLFIIAGCNGAGKTTASFTILPDVFHLDIFVNADEIARGLSPLNPDKSSIEAGRMMLSKIDQHVDNRTDFAFETTLASKSFVKTIRKAKNAGYNVSLIFYYLDSEQLAIERVETRVKEGGHNIPKDVIIRRYYAGIRNLFELYMPICNYWSIFNNSTTHPEFIAMRMNDTALKIENSYIFELIRKKAGNETER